MLKAKNEYDESYRPQHHRSRFWISAESCYTDNELEQRTWILSTRANAKIHPDYLINPSSWFGDDSQALINIYEHSWFHSKAFKPRHILTRDDFYVHPMDSQRLQWPVLYELMQKTGDYLLLRNSKLPKDHLNQPMNFFFLDLNNILKGISQNPDVQQTKVQLKFLYDYVRTIEKNTFPTNSDRLFLTNFRSTIDNEIHPLLLSRIDSQLLKDRLAKLSKTIEQLSTERNRILHFALNPKPVNPHSYTFLITHVDDLKPYPTQMVKACQKSSTDLIEHTASARPLTAKELQNCPNFELINMQTEVLEHYAKAISDLNELNHFHTVITQTIELLGQAGEVYTVFQFKEQLSLLLEQIHNFINDSSTPIEKIINTNTQEYKKAVRKVQDLSLIEKWLTSEFEKLNQFIKNQDILDQYPSTIPELAETAQMLKNQANNIGTHLNDPTKRGADFAALAGKAQALNTLMDSMHHWIKVQYEHKGLMPPKEPIKLQLLPPSSVQKLQPKNKYHSPFFESKKDLPIANIYQNRNYFHEAPPLPISTKQLLLLSAPAGQHSHTEQESLNPVEYMNFLTLIPLGLFALYLIYRTFHKSKNNIRTLSSKQEYESIKTELEDFIVSIQQSDGTHELEKNPLFQDLIDNYHQLNVQAQHGIYDIEKLKALYEDIQDISNESLSVLYKNKM